MVMMSHASCQAKNGFHSLTGIDYSSYAIELAKSIACDEQLDIEYQVSMSSVELS